MHPPALLFAGTLVCLPVVTQASVLIGSPAQYASVSPERLPLAFPGISSQGFKAFESTLQGEIVTCRSDGNFPLSIPSQLSAIPEPSSSFAVGALMASGMLIRQRRRK